MRSSFILMMLVCFPPYVLLVCGAARFWARRALSKGCDTPEDGRWLAIEASIIGVFAILLAPATFALPLVLWHGEPPTMGLLFLLYVGLDRLLLYHYLPNVPLLVGLIVFICAMARKSMASAKIVFRVVLVGAVISSVTAVILAFSVYPFGPLLAEVILINMLAVMWKGLEVMHDEKQSEEIKQRWLDAKQAWDVAAEQAAARIAGRSRDEPEDPPVQSQGT